MTPPADLLTLASVAAAAFGSGVLVGRLLTLREPPLREPVRPAEACVEEWTAEDGHVRACHEIQGSAIEDCRALCGTIGEDDKPCESFS